MISALKLLKQLSLPVILGSMHLSSFLRALRDVGGRKDCAIISMLR